MEIIFKKGINLSSKTFLVESLVKKRLEGTGIKWNVSALMDKTRNKIHFLEYGRSDGILLQMYANCSCICHAYISSCNHMVVLF